MWKAHTLNAYHMAWKLIIMQLLQRISNFWSSQYPVFLEYSTLNMGVSIPGKCILFLFAYRGHDPAEPFFLHLPMAFTTTTQRYSKTPWQSTLTLQPNIVYMQHFWGQRKTIHRGSSVTTQPVYMQWLLKLYFLLYVTAPHHTHLSSLSLTTNPINSPVPIEFHDKTLQEIFFQGVHALLSFSC